MAPIATNVKSPADNFPMRSPKFNNPTARLPRITEKLSQLRNVRSLAKKTLGSIRTGREIRLPVKKRRDVWSENVSIQQGLKTKEANEDGISTYQQAVGARLETTFFRVIE